jgi:uncharacterized protein (TIGR03000 family)
MMPVRPLVLNLLSAFAAIVLFANTGQSQVTVVNMIPRSMSNETDRDSEPNLAVNPANPLQMAASAFTSDPMGSGLGPIFLSSDSGNTWTLNPILPGGDRTVDITLRFGKSSNILYAGILRYDNHNLNILRVSLGSVTTLIDRGDDDQPYVETEKFDSGGTALDRVYVGNNDLSLWPGKTATVDRSVDAATAAPPAGFGPLRIEARSTAQQDGPSIRTTVHPDGTVYAAYFGWRSPSSSGVISDIVVVRDDNWAGGPATFQALVDPDDGLPGIRVAKSVPIPFRIPFVLLGTQRIGSSLTIAVDPRNSKTVFLAWADGTGAADYTIHVRRSTDGGFTWSADLYSVAPATNPSLTVNSEGRAGLLYQKLTGTPASQRWQTHLETSVDDFASAPSDLILADVPDQNGSYTGQNPIGDYTHLMSVGTKFYGVFSGNNTPDRNNFPNGVIYQRNADFTSKKLLGLDNVTEVPVSIDPFFFVAEVAEPAPRYAYKGCRGDHHLAGDTGTGFYSWKHQWWLVNLVYDKADNDFWYYHEKEYPKYRWAFGKEPEWCWEFPVWFNPNDECGGKWVFYQYAGRAKPVNATEAGRSLRAQSNPSAGDAEDMDNATRQGLGRESDRQLTRYLREGWPARIVVDLPADATLSFDGQRTTSTSAQRVFETPALLEGKEYQYTVKAEISRGGRMRVITRNVIVRAGQETRLRFEDNSAVIAAK